MNCSLPFNWATTPPRLKSINTVSVCKVWVLDKKIRLWRQTLWRTLRTGKKWLNCEYDEGEKTGGGEQMERSCLGDSCLVKCDGETARQRQRARDEINGGRGGREKGGNGVNDNKTKQTNRSRQMGQSTMTDDMWAGEDVDPHTVTNANKCTDTCGRVKIRRQCMGARRRKQRHTVAQGFLWDAASCPDGVLVVSSGSFNTGSINSKKSVCPKPEPSCTLESQASNCYFWAEQKRLTGLNKIRARERSVAAPGLLKYLLVYNTNWFTLIKCWEKYCCSCANATNSPNNDTIIRQWHIKICTVCQIIKEIPSDLWWVIYTSSAW